MGFLVFLRPIAAIFLGNHFWTSFNFVMILQYVPKMGKLVPLWCKKVTISETVQKFFFCF